MVSSIAPRLGARCPPVLETTSATYCRSSAASCSSSLIDSLLRSAGELTSGSRGAVRDSAPGRTPSWEPPRTAGTLILPVIASDIGRLALGSDGPVQGSRGHCRDIGAHHRPRGRRGQERGAWARIPAGTVCYSSPPGGAPA